MRTRGVSPRRAARLLDRHFNTVYAWCRASVRGEPSPLKAVTRDPHNGYYRIDLAEVNRLRATGGDEQ